MMFRFAIIGCGNSGSKHAAQVFRVGTLVAVCDVVANKAAFLARTYDVPAYNDFDQLISKERVCDIIIVCTPNGTHAEYCIKSLQAGFHVLCEGPLCLTTAAAWQMIETEKFCRKRILVANTLTLNKASNELKKHIKFLEGGGPISFELTCTMPYHQKEDWRNTVFPGGGTLYSYFSRYIDLILFMFGAVEDVKASISKTQHQEITQAEDYGEAELHFKNGTTGKLSWKLDLKSISNGKLVINGLHEPFLIEGGVLASIIDAGEETYQLMFDHMKELMTQQGLPEMGLYHNLQTVHTIERIYKAVSSNPS